MSDNLAAGIARANKLEAELALKASKPRDVEYLGGAEQCNSIWEPDVASRVYVTWGEHGPLFWSTTRATDMAVTTYVVQAELEEALDALEGLDDDEPCWIDHNGNCQAHGINNPCDNAIARAILTKHGRTT